MSEPVALPARVVETKAEPSAGPVPTSPSAPALAFIPMHRGRAALYMLASLLLSVTQGFGMNMVTVNLTTYQGELGITSAEVTWLVAAYMAPNVSLSLALIKIRNQYGLRRYAEISILGFVVACLLNLAITDFNSALIVRFMSGIAAAPMSSLAFLYMLEPFPPERKLSTGLSLALSNSALGMPLARILSPTLLDIGQTEALKLVEVAMALVACAMVYTLPLTSPPRAKVISRWDVISYLFIAVGFGALAVVLATGRIYWWFDVPWLGVLIAVSSLAIAAAVIIELNRKSPLIDIRWITSPQILHFTAALFVFRLVLSEQTTGAAGFYQALGLTNWQMQSLYGAILASAVAGGITCALLLKPGREPKLHLAALVLITVGAFLDSRSTSLTRPSDMILSQSMVAFAGSLFLPPAMASGLLSALKKGPNYILSFIVIFLLTQSLGGLFGSAVFGTFIQMRQTAHGQALSENIVLADPMVAQRLSQYGGALKGAIADASARDLQGLTLMRQVITREATVLAYNDAFLLISAIALVALIALLMHMTLIAFRDRQIPYA